LTQSRAPGVRPVPPRALNPCVATHPAAVSLKCPSQDLARRYRSAVGLARDLERWLAYQEVEARPLPPLHWERVRRWCIRNPGLAAGAVLLSALLAAGTSATLALIREKEVRAVDLGAGSAVPGLADAHGHEIDRASGTLIVVRPGKRIPLDVSEGDEVLYSKYGGTEIKVDGEELLVLRESDVLAKVQ